MGSWIEAFRLVGTVIALMMMGTVIAVSLIFEAPSNWPHRHFLTAGLFKRGRSAQPIRADRRST